MTVKRRKKIYIVMSISSQERVEIMSNLRNELRKKLGDRFIFTMPHDLHENKVINNLSISEEEMRLIMNKCKNAIKVSDCVLAIGNFGISTAWELGYYFRCKEISVRKKIALFKADKLGVAYREHMIMPNFDIVTEDIDELIAWFERLC